MLSSHSATKALHSNSDAGIMMVGINFLLSLNSSDPYFFFAEPIIPPSQILLMSSLFVQYVTWSL